MVGRIDRGIETVTAADAEPVRVHDAAAPAHGARPAPAAVVLQPDVDVVRPAHVGADDVRQRGGHRVDEVPGLALVPADVETAVVAAHDVLRVLRVDPDAVLIDVAGLAAAAGFVERHERLAAVERFRDRQARDVDRLVVRRIDADLAEVHRARVAVADVRPGLALVLGAEDAAARRIEWRHHLRRSGRAGLLASTAAETPSGSGVVAPVVTAAATRAASARNGCCRWRCGLLLRGRLRRRAAALTRRRDGSRTRGCRFRGRGLLHGRRLQRPSHLAGLDLRVDDVGIRTRDVERDAAVGARRQPVAGQLVPRLAGVSALPDRAAGTAAVEAAAGAAPLVARRVDDAGVHRIEDDVGEAGVVVDELDVVPGLAAVGRLVDAAFRVRAEEMAERRDVDRVGVLRIDDDARDRLRLFQPDVGEGLAAVGRLVDAVAERRGLAVVRLAGADVDDVRVARMDGDVADRGGGVGVEHRLERHAVVLRLPHAADGVAKVDDVGIGLRHRDVVDAAAHARRADGAEAEAAQQRIVGLVDDRRRRDRCRCLPGLGRGLDRQYRKGECRKRRGEHTRTSGRRGNRRHMGAKFTTRL